MRRGGGKAKGAAFERYICKALSLWVTNGEHIDVFWRSALSGGRATVRNRKAVEVRQAGDICAVAPEGHALTDRYYFELKHVKKLALDQFLIKGTGLLANFWKKAQREAAKHKRTPVIIARQNGWPDIVISVRDCCLFDPLQARIRAGAVSIAMLNEMLRRPCKLKAIK